MKKLLLFALPLFLIYNCGDKVREEITERYESGSKKLLLVYKGEGKNEEVDPVAAQFKQEKIEGSSFLKSKININFILSPIFFQKPIFTSF